MSSYPTPADDVPARLRDVEHPELSSTLAHFVKRRGPAGPEVSEDITAMDAEKRLESILWCESLSAFPTFSMGDPAVCLTETSWEGMSFLIRRRGYEPWALLFDRQSVYDAGGGPVWYARPAQYATLAPELRSWAVRFDPPESDWLEEREWRVPRRAVAEDQVPSVSLQELGLCGVVVGVRNWCPERHNYDLGDGTQPWHWEPPQALFGVPRYWWNPVSEGFDQIC